MTPMYWQYRNREHCNLPRDELNALKELINLQKERQIVIKACNKGAGIIILNFNDYMQACYNYILSKTANNQPYYSQVDDSAVERAQKKIDSILEEGRKEKYITKNEFDAMSGKEKTPGRFYANFKVHKPHNHKEAPPVRTIISGSGSITEGITTFVEYHLKESAVTHETYIQDTPDFLRHIAEINKGT